MSARILVVGWDGADRSSVGALLDQGRLPALAGILADGCRNDLTGYPGLGDDAHWCSFSTGLTPGEHGRFHHCMVRPGRYEQSHVRRSTLRHEAFWRQLSRAGMRIAAIDIPKSPVNGAIDGLEVADWMTHGEESPHAVICPPDDPDAALFAAEPGFDCHATLTSVSALEAHSRAVIARGERRRQATGHLLAREPWDLFVTVQAEVHCAGHHHWHRHFADAGDPADAVSAALEQADESLAALLVAAGPAEAVMIVSLTGMTATTGAPTIVDELLRRWEQSTPIAAMRRSGPVTRLRRLRHGPLRRTVHAGRLAWALGGDGAASPIRLNLRGRERAGVVEPGPDVDVAIAELSRHFSGLRDATTDRGIVSEVLRVDQAYPGPLEHRFADLIVVWDAPADLETVVSPTFGRLEVAQEPARSGSHRGGGWMVTRGCSLEEREGASVPVHELAAIIGDAAGCRPPG